jgi:hypothetical protein
VSAIRLDRVLNGLLRAAARLVPPHRREWIAAVWAEQWAAPHGRPRLAWLAGGLWLVVREAQMLYRIGYAAVFAAGLGGILWVRETGGLPLPAIVGLTAIGVMLIGLPWVARTRGMFGPVRDGSAAKAVRIGGYAALLAFLVLGLAAAHYSNAGRPQPPGWGAIPIWTFVFFLWTVYAAGILATTTRRSAATSATLAIGAGSGLLGGIILYGLTPYSGRLHFANPWAGAAYNIGLILVVIGVPVLTGAVAAARPEASVPTETVDPPVARARQGALAGALCGAVVVLAMSTLTLTTLLIVPERVSVEWANPDRNVPHGTPEEIRMSVGDDVVKYLNLLMLGPIAGAMLGAVGAAVQGRDRSRRESPERTLTARP